MTINFFVGAYIFMLAAFAGWVIIGNVPAILHTPLMSGSNFVHGIVVVGGLFVLLNAANALEQAIGFFAVLLGAGNAAGGYAVTDQNARNVQIQLRAEKPHAAGAGPRAATRRRHNGRCSNDSHSFVIGATGFAAALLFMYGLKRMSSPATAASGIRVAGVGHARRGRSRASFTPSTSGPRPSRSSSSISGSPSWLSQSGVAIAWWSGKKVAMTAMPQMVALYNGMGGGAAGAIAAVELFGRQGRRRTDPTRS